MRLSAACILLAIGLCRPVNADDWGPWKLPAAELREQQAAASKGPLQLAVRFFQKYISPVDGPRCPMYPTCSAYSLQALHKHGPLLGTFLTVDRLYHEGDPHEQQKPIDKWGLVRYYDPLAQNDFWLERQTD